MSKNKNCVKLILLGNSNVGKTTIHTSFKYQCGLCEPSCTLTEDIWEKDFKIGEKDINVKLIDSPGQDRYFEIMSNRIREIDGIIFIYDITNLNSFLDIKNWYSNVNVILCANDVHFFLVGNKSDLLDRKVPISNGIELAQDLECTFYETNVTNSSNIYNMINYFAGIIINKKSNLSIEQENQINLSVEKNENKCNCF